MQDSFQQRETALQDGLFSVMSLRLRLGILRLVIAERVLSLRQWLQRRTPSLLGKAEAFESLGGSGLSFYYALKRGEADMGREDNLRPIQLSHDEATMLGSKGGKASVKAKAERKTLRETLSYLLSQPDKDGIVYQDKVNLALVLKAAKGDSKAYEVLRDTIGEKPTDTVKVSVASFKGLEDAFNEMGSNDHTG